MHIPKRFLVKLSFQIDEVLPDHVLRLGDIQPMLQMELWSLGMILRMAFRKEFSRPLGGLERFADSNSIPYNRTTIVHKILTVGKRLRFLLSLFVLLFRQFRWSRIDEVLTFCDSMIILHRISQMPRSCLHI